MNIELIKVEEKDKNIISNLMQLYNYDMNQYVDIKLHEDGLFELDQYLKYYWIEDTRHPYLLKYNNKIAGFALVRFNEDNRYEIAEFFVLNIYRRLGIGRYMAKEIFSTFNGNWEVRTLIKNISAQEFWRNTIKEFTNNNFEKKLIRNGSNIAFYFTT